MGAASTPRRRARTDDVTAPEASPAKAGRPSITELLPGPLNQKLGIEVVEAAVDRVVATMPVTGNTQPFGLLHGGASIVLAETIGSVGAGLHAGPDRVAVGTEVSATHHRSASSGHVTGVATPLHLGRTTATYDVVVTDHHGRRICTARVSCALIQPRE